MVSRGDTDPDRTKVSVVDPLVGTVVDRRYRIEFRLAAGGFGAIYRATHVITGREVALKVLHTQLATERDLVARFRREGAALARLGDPHTITAYDFGEAPDGTLYIVMELLQGESLYERFSATGPLPWRRVIWIARQVCSSLAEAHAQGIVHRDLKPTNIHLERVGGDPDFVKVLDFGIAKILHGSELDSQDLTRSGQMVGTFDYMPPEQMVGSPTTVQSDIYTLGVVMYEMISGERPFGDPSSPAAMLAAIISQPIAPISTRSNAPEDLDPILARCLDREMVKRYPNVEALATDLDAVLATAEDVTNTRQTRAPSEPSAGDSLTGGRDTETWIDAVPEPPNTLPQNPLTTLPGVVPPDRNTPWPIKKK